MEAIRRLKAVLAPIMLRRTKASLLDVSSGTLRVTFLLYLALVHLPLPHLYRSPTARTIVMLLDLQAGCIESSPKLSMNDISHILMTLC